MEKDEFISYWDLVIVIDGTEYRLSDNYAYQLQGTRAGGLSLWHVWDGQEKLIGNEFDNDFILKIKRDAEVD